MEATIRERNLPHWDVPGGTYFVTACLHDSIPARGLRRLEAYRRELTRRPRPAHLSVREWRRRHRILEFRKTDELMDTEPAKRWLAKPDLAAKVRESVHHFAGVRYDVFAYVVMPSHFHWIFRPTRAFEQSMEGDRRTPRERIMHTLKLRTARECNRLQKRRGRFWQDESYDHWVRDDRELYWLVDYVERNPVKVGLAAAPEEFEFSSAHDRRLWGVESGIPVSPPGEHP